MRKFLKGLAWVVGILAVIVGLGRLLLFRVWRVPEDPMMAASLAPTLEAGDLVLVLFRGERVVGDLVRCPHPEEPTRWISGRITGIAGDRVLVDGGFVQVNGRKYRTTEACVENHLEVTGLGGVKNTLSCSRVEFAGGWHFIAMPLDGAVSNESTVGAGRYYLVSDNRNDSFDSRDFGTVPAETCTEKIVFRLWGKNGFFDDERRFEYVR